MDSAKIRYFFPKVKNRLLMERKRFWKYRNVERLSMRGYKPFADAVDFKSRLYSMLGKYGPDILVGISDKDRRIILDNANQTLRHEFDLLGSGVVKLDPIDWHKDFKCGARWEKKWYREIGFIKGADIKVPWELSRCQHLLWLGEAFLLTSNEKYAREVIDEINCWIDDNPFMYSVNWTCAMDVAFRAVNWIFALNMIAESEVYDDTYADKICRSLWQHGFFIKNNLERQVPYSNNHYASDIVGLLYLGELFYSLPKGKKWARFAFNEYVSEVRNQVLPTGVHYERSISYHRLMAELLSYPAYMLNRLGVEIPKDVTGLIGKMYQYISNYTKPNGFAPLIADNDDGRFVPFLRRDFREHNYLNDEASIENRFNRVNTPTLFSEKEQCAKLYTDAGVAIVREGKNYLFINNGGYSKHPEDNETTIGTHTHNDLLSFELVMNGEDLLIDAGTYLYTSSKKDRDAFRSTLKHNTVVVDGEEQNDFYRSFVLKRNVNKGELKIISDGVFEGNYTTIAGQMNHKRQFSFKCGVLEITDIIKKAGTGHEAKLFFHFAENISCEIESNSIVSDNGFSIGFDIIPDNLVLKDDTISPSFGVLKKTKTGVVTFRFSDQIKILTTVKALAYHAL